MLERFAIDTLCFGEVSRDAGVQIATAGGHYQPAQRRHAHGCVDAFALLDRRHAGPTTQMGKYNPALGLVSDIFG